MKAPNGTKPWRWVVVLSLLLAAGPGPSPAAENLPVTPAETLSGQKLSFPAALAGKPAVCVFGFSREAGDRTKDWMTLLSKDGVNAWSIANLESAPGLVRGMIRSSMRKGTPPAQIEHSLVMTKDEQAWKRTLGVRDDKLPFVVLLDAAGKAVWTYEGPPGDPAYRELKAKLGALISK